MVTTSDRGERVHHDAPVDRDLVDAREIRRERPQRAAVPPPRSTEPERRAGNREDRDFGQQLARDSRARRAEQ